LNHFLQLDKGWTQGDHYSRAEQTHPRLKPFSMLRDEEMNFYRERCAECVRAAIAMNYHIDLADPEAHTRAAPSATSGTT
jgi:ryanodine receptor 2